MSVTASVLIFSTDEGLRDEATRAFDALGEDAPRFRFVTTENELFQLLRTQPIELVLPEFTANPKELLSLVRRVHTTVPGLAVAAILRPEGFPDTISESSVLIDAMRCGVCDFLRRPLSTGRRRHRTYRASDRARRADQTRWS